MTTVTQHFHTPKAIKVGIDVEEASQLTPWYGDAERPVTAYLPKGSEEKKGYITHEAAYVTMSELLYVKGLEELEFADGTEHGSFYRWAGFTLTGNTKDTTPIEHVRLIHPDGRTERAWLWSCGWC